MSLQSKGFLVAALSAVALLVGPEASARRPPQRTSAAFHPETGALTEYHRLTPGFYWLVGGRELPNNHLLVAIPARSGRTFVATVDAAWLQRRSAPTPTTTFQDTHRPTRPEWVLAVPSGQAVDAWQEQVPITWLPDDARRDQVEAAGDRLASVEIDVIQKRDSLLVVELIVHFKEGTSHPLSLAGSYRVEQRAVLSEPGVGAGVTLLAGSEVEVLGLASEQGRDGSEYLRARARAPRGAITGHLPASARRTRVQGFTRSETSLDDLERLVPDGAGAPSRLETSAPVHDLQGTTYLDLPAGATVVPLRRSTEGRWVWVGFSQGAEGLIDARHLGPSYDPADHDPPSGFSAARDLTETASRDAPGGAPRDSGGPPNGWGLADIVRGQQDNPTGPGESWEQRSARLGPERLLEDIFAMLEKAPSWIETRPGAPAESSDLLVAAHEAREALAHDPEPVTPELRALLDEAIGALRVASLEEAREERGQAEVETSERVRPDEVRAARLLLSRLPREDEVTEFEHATTVRLRQATAGMAYSVDNLLLCRFATLLVWIEQARGVDDVGASLAQLIRRGDRDLRVTRDAAGPLLQRLLNGESEWEPQFKRLVDLRDRILDAQDVLRRALITE